MAAPENTDRKIRNIEKNPKFHNLVNKRSRFAWILTILMLIVYYGYIGLIAFDKELLATSLGNGVTTLGMPIGLGVIIFTVVITGIYVYRANTEYDAVTEEILKEAEQ